MIAGRTRTVPIHTHHLNATARQDMREKGRHFDDDDDGGNGDGVGVSGDGVSGDGGDEDEDEDECVNGNHECGENEDCTDTYTSFECNCKAGYERER